MPCNDCGNTTEGCGCQQEALHISQICNPIDCPSNECSETFDAQCIIYTGDDITCEDVILGTSGETIAQITANIVAYFCSTEGVTDAISCGVDEVVPADTSFGVALPLVVAYFCNAIENISLTPGPQGDPGIDGVDGTNGTDGVDGMRILSAYNSATGVGNTAGVSTVNAITVSIPGNTLANDGDEYEMDLYTEYQENDPIDLEIGIGAGATWTKTIANAENDKRFIKIIVARIDQNNQMWTIKSLSQNALSQEYVDEMDVIYTTKNLSTTENWTVNLINLGTAVANSLVLHKAVLKLNKV
jgi:hypothetical protein